MGGETVVKISVVGCGYLGAVHAASMAELGHEVVGVDVDRPKVEALQQATTQSSALANRATPDAIRVSVVRIRFPPRRFATMF